MRHNPRRIWTPEEDDASGNRCAVPLAYDAVEEGKDEEGQEKENDEADDAAEQDEPVAPDDGDDLFARPGVAEVCLPDKTHESPMPVSMAPMKTKTPTI